MAKLDLHSGYWIPVPRPEPFATLHKPIRSSPRLKDESIRQPSAITNVATVFPRRSILSGSFAHPISRWYLVGGELTRDRSTGGSARYLVRCEIPRAKASFGRAWH
jgi:hypothetical protein